MDVRVAEQSEIDCLAKIWYDGWHDAHGRIVPAELARLRTLESFRDRLQAALPDVRVVGPCGKPLGFPEDLDTGTMVLFCSHECWRKAEPSV